MGHPFSWWAKIAKSGGLGFVLSHPSAEKSGWMGHPGLWSAERDGLGIVLSPVPKCEGPGAPIFVVGVGQLGGDENSGWDSGWEC